MDYNADGVINSNDMAPVKHLNYPTTTMGLTLGGSYKGFGFSLLLYSALGVYKEAIAAYLWDFPGGNIKTQPNTLDTWKTGTHTEGAVRPSIHVNNAYNSVASTYSYSNHSYLRLKNIELGYTLPQKLTQKVFISRLRLYVSAENLFTITKYHGFDPEISSGGTSLGVDYGVYPQARVWRVGFNLEF